MDDGMVGMSIAMEMAAALEQSDLATSAMDTSVSSFASSLPDSTRDGLMAANDHDSGHVQAQAVATDVGNAPALDQAQDLAVFMPTEAEQALIPAALHEVAPPSVPRTRKHGNMYSLEIRKLCVDKFDQGMKYKDIAMELGMPATSVQLIVKRAKQLGSVQVGQRTGRPRRTDGAVDDFIMELMRAEPSVTPLIVQSKLEEHKKVKISLQTVRRRMEECSAQQRQQYAVLPDMYGGASTTCKAAGNAMAELTTLSFDTADSHVPTDFADASAFPPSMMSDAHDAVFPVPISMNDSHHAETSLTDQLIVTTVLDLVRAVPGISLAAIQEHMWITHQIHVAESLIARALATCSSPRASMAIPSQPPESMSSATVATAKEHSTFLPTGATESSPRPTCVQLSESTSVPSTLALETELSNNSGDLKTPASQPEPSSNIKSATRKRSRQVTLPDDDELREMVTSVARAGETQDPALIREILRTDKHVDISEGVIRKLLQHDSLNPDDCILSDSVARSDEGSGGNDADSDHASSTTGQKKTDSKYTVDMRQLIVRMHEQDGLSYGKIAQELNVPTMMVRNIIRNAQQSGEMQPQSRPSGRPRQTTELIDLVILQAVRTNQISSAPQIQQELKRHNVDVSCETIRRRVKEYNKNRLAVAVGPADNQTSGKGVLGLDPSRIELLLVQMEQHNSASKPATTKRPSTSASTKKRTTAKVPSKAPIQSSTKKKKHGDYSLEVRELCLKKHDEGMGLRDIGRELGMPYTTVRAIIKKIKATGTLERGKRTGRPKKTDDEADEVIIRTIAANPRCSAKQIQSELQNIDVNVSCETIRRRVKEFHRKQHSDLGLPILEAPATFAVSSLS